MRIKDSFGRYTADDDVTFTSSNAAINVHVREDNIVEFELLPLMMDASADVRYQLADARITSHLTDMDNPHNTVSWFIEATKDAPATGDIIYETIVPDTEFFTFDVMSLEAYIFPGIEINSILKIDVQINGTSVYNDPAVMMTTETGWQNSYYFVLNMGEPSYIWEAENRAYSLQPGDYIRVIALESYNIPKVMFRMLCW